MRKFSLARMVTAGYLCNSKIISHFYRLTFKYPPCMKNKLFLALTLLTLVVLATSCASQKYGCPGNPQASSKFRS